MDEIVDSVKRVTDIMGEITAASQEQTTGIEQINQAITQMDQVTQQNAALVEEAAAAAQSLQEQAAGPAVAVSAFKRKPSVAALQRCPLPTEFPAIPADNGRNNLSQHRSMSNLFSTGLSGLAVARAALHTTAHNTANVYTEGYSRQTAQVALQPAASPRPASASSAPARR